MRAYVKEGVFNTLAAGAVGIATLVVLALIHRGALREIARYGDVGMPFTMGSLAFRLIGGLFTLYFALRAARFFWLDFRAARKNRFS